MSEYHIVSSSYFILRDIPNQRERLLFHLRTGDYFAMLATALGFVEEGLSSREKRQIGENPSPELVLLRDMKKDLLFLNAQYEIHKKAEKRGSRDANRKQ